MPIMYGTVAAPSVPSAVDSSNQPMLQGKAGELVDANLHGKYYTQAYRGVAFIGTTAAGGVVPPNYSTSAQTFGIWNPAGNTKNGILQTLDAGLVTLGTPAVSSFGLTVIPNAGSAIGASGAPITAFTAVVPFAANLAVAVANTVRFANSTATTTTAGSLLMALPWGYFSTTTTTVATLATPLLHYDFDSGIIVSPNVAVFVVANILTGSTWNLTLRWYESAV